MNLIQLVHDLIRGYYVDFTLCENRCLMVNMLVELLFLENSIKTIDWKKCVPHRRGDFMWLPCISQTCSKTAKCRAYIKPYHPLSPSSGNNKRYARHFTSLNKQAYELTVIDFSISPPPAQDYSHDTCEIDRPWWASFAPAVPPICPLKGTPCLKVGRSTPSLLEWKLISHRFKSLSPFQSSSHFSLKVKPLCSTKAFCPFQVKKHDFTSWLMFPR